MRSNIFGKNIIDCWWWWTVHVIHRPNLIILMDKFTVQFT